MLCSNLVFIFVIFLAEVYSKHVQTNALINFSQTEFMFVCERENYVNQISNLINQYSQSDRKSHGPQTQWTFDFVHCISLSISNGYCFWLTVSLDFYYITKQLINRRSKRRRTETQRQRSSLWMKWRGIRITQQENIITRSLNHLFNQLQVHTLTQPVVYPN